MRRVTVAIAGLSLAAAAAAVGVIHACVPADTRPAPRTLTMTVSPSPALANGVVTADGWALTFSRVLVGIGNPGLSGACTEYSEADYDRVLDVTKLRGQKLGVLHGIGKCYVRFRVSSPSSDALLGAGVTEEDKTRMRTPGGDKYVPLGGIALDVTGSATQGATTKQFHFTFRPRVRYRDCNLALDGGGHAEPGVDLASNENVTYDIRIEAEALFRDDDTPSAAALRFAPFAAADTNQDGLVTMEELEQVPIAALRDAGPFEAGTYDFADDGGVVGARSVAIATLADYVYVVLMPTIARFRGVGFCTPNIQISVRRD